MGYQHQLLTITFWVPGYAYYDWVGGSCTYIRNDLRRKIPNQRWIQLVEIGVRILVMNPSILDAWFRLLQEKMN